MLSLHLILIVSLYTRGLSRSGHNHVHSTAWSIYSSPSASSSTPDKTSTSQAPTSSLTTSSQTTSIRTTTSFTSKTETTRETTSSTSTMGTSSTTHYTSSSSIGTTTTTGEVNTTISSTTPGTSLTYTMTPPVSSVVNNDIGRSISVVNSLDLSGFKSGVEERVFSIGCFVIVFVFG